MSAARPSPDEERWLAVAHRLGGAVPPDLLADRTGGWRTTGPLARVALFVLGQLAASLAVGILGFRGGALLVGGVAAALAAEWLIRTKRLHASGVEEGLCVGGWLAVGGWAVLEAFGDAGGAGERAALLMLIAVAFAAGLRLLNPLVTTAAAFGAIAWLGTTGVATAFDRAFAPGSAWLVLAAAGTASALTAGAVPFRRPSHDRMLDWLVATLPLVALARHESGRAFATSPPIDATRGATLAIVVLAALGTTALAIGVRRRRHAPLLCTLACAVGVAVELRHAFALAAETWLIGVGLAALAIGLALDRLLRRPRAGITSARLDAREGAFDVLQGLGAATLAQRGAAHGAAPAEPPVQPGGGRYGGGGASGGF